MATISFTKFFASQMLVGLVWAQMKIIPCFWEQIYHLFMWPLLLYTPCKLHWDQYYLGLLAISFPPTLQAHISTLESMVWIVLAAKYNWHTFVPMFHQFVNHQSGYLILVYEYILLVAYFCHIVSTLNLYREILLHMYCTDTVTKECSLNFYCWC